MMNFSTIPSTLLYSYIHTFSDIFGWIIWVRGHRRNLIDIRSWATRRQSCYFGPANPKCRSKLIKRKKKVWKNWMYPNQWFSRFFWTFRVMAQKNQQILQRTANKIDFSVFFFFTTKRKKKKRQIPRFANLVVSAVEWIWSRAARCVGWVRWRSEGTWTSLDDRRWRYWSVLETRIARDSGMH